MIDWQAIGLFKEPDWDTGTTKPEPVLFWRPGKGATFGFIRDGELFNATWIYVSDSNKVTHFVAINPPAEKVVDLASRRADKT
jgi:hypothetical protein